MRSFLGFSSAQSPSGPTIQLMLVSDTRRRIPDALWLLVRSDDVSSLTFSLQKSDAPPSRWKTKACLNPEVREELGALSIHAGFETRTALYNVGGSSETTCDFR